MRQEMIFDHMEKEVGDTAKKLVIWSIVISVVMAAVTAVIMYISGGWQTEILKVLAGFVFGAALASFMAIHMASSLSKSVDMDEAGALKRTRRDYLIRTGIVLLSVTILYFTGMINILALLGGLLSLKPATYVQMFFQEKYVPKDEDTGEEEE